MGQFRRKLRKQKRAKRNTENAVNWKGTEMGKMYAKMFEIKCGDDFRGPAARRPERRRRTGRRRLPLWQGVLEVELTGQC